MQNSIDSAHKVTDGRFRNENLNDVVSDMRIELESLDEKKEVNDRLQNSLVEGMKNDIRNFMTAMTQSSKKYLPSTAHLEKLASRILIGSNLFLLLMIQASLRRWKKFVRKILYSHLVQIKRDREAV